MKVEGESDNESRGEININTVVSFLIAFIILMLLMHDELRMNGEKIKMFLFFNTDDELKAINGLR
jgi:hypothetical protein